MCRICSTGGTGATDRDPTSANWKVTVSPNFIAS
jgi:hypothetical protein